MNQSILLSEKHFISNKDTHNSKTTNEIRASFENFYVKELRELGWSSNNLCDLGNMEKTPLPFVLEDSQKNNTKGVYEVLCLTEQSEFNKSHCSIQVTLFLGGSTRLFSLIIFRGKCLHISADEKRK